MKQYTIKVDELKKETTCIRLLNVLWLTIFLAVIGLFVQQMKLNESEIEKAELRKQLHDALLKNNRDSVIANAIQLRLKDSLADASLREEMEVTKNAELRNYQVKLMNEITELKRLLRNESARRRHTDSNIDQQSVESDIMSQPTIPDVSKQKFIVELVKTLIPGLHKPTQLIHLLFYPVIAATSIIALLRFKRRRKGILR